LDLVITGFGSARLSEFDLDIASPLETTRYMAPEAIAGGVAPASDWWRTHPSPKILWLVECSFSSPFSQS
jgi:hypothetical protein